jgi:hypothetical protein
MVVVSNQVVFSLETGLEIRTFDVGAFPGAVAGMSEDVATQIFGILECLVA